MRRGAAQRYALVVVADVLGVLAAAVTVPAILVAVPPFGRRGRTARHRETRGRHR